MAIQKIDLKKDLVKMLLSWYLDGAD
jgi:hypothetical protein